MSFQTSFIYLWNMNEDICNILFSIQINSIKVLLYSAFHNANIYKAALQKIKVSTLYLVVAYQWWLSQVDVHPYGRNVQ